jgi:hypothetical protein
MEAAPKGLAVPITINVNLKMGNDYIPWLPPIRDIGALTPTIW